VGRRWALGVLLCLAVGGAQPGGGFEFVSVWNTNAGRTLSATWTRSTSRWITGLYLRISRRRQNESAPLNNNGNLRHVARIWHGCGVEGNKGSIHTGLARDKSWARGKMTVVKDPSHLNAGGELLSKKKAQGRLHGPCAKVND